MKRFLLACTVLLGLLVAAFWAYFNTSLYTPFVGEPTVWAKHEGKTVLVNQGEGFAPFEIKGVDLGAGKPGYFATDYAITYEEYIRWFGQMQQMGANCIRVYTVLGMDFYRAFFDYNQNNPNPLYLLHGLWLNDYTNFSHIDGFDSEFLETMAQEGMDLVNILHGRQMASLGRQQGSGVYRWDVSPWTLGYILGVEWEDVTVAFTDHMNPEKTAYQGSYLSAGENASPFERVLAEIGDEIIRYETERYGQQRLLAFANWPTTDPIDYSKEPVEAFSKYAKVDVENLVFEPAFASGTFASYHIYPYYPDFLSYYLDETPFLDESGRVNSYRAYLKLINEHHTIPVIITEFGLPSSRGMAREELIYGRGQGFMNEQEQADALQECYRDIMEAGCAGSIVFTWQDEWFERTWNTMALTDTRRTAYWSDYQTNEQFFGLMAFDPGAEKTVCLLDGDPQEWSAQDWAYSREDLNIYKKQDERYLYFLVQKPGLSSEVPLYLPLDITPKSGATYAEGLGLSFERPADFVLLLKGEENSRLLVQERYDVFRSQYLLDLEGKEAFAHPPALDSSQFNPIRLQLQNLNSLARNPQGSKPHTIHYYETGKLLAGNGDPSSPAYNSLADFCWGENTVEIRIPWSLLNFACPAEGDIHDDYYQHYGIEYTKIRSIAIGAATEEQRYQSIPFGEVKLKHWGDKTTSHERLKPSYYAMQTIWKEE